MSTRSQNKVVPSSTTPNMAVHPAGSGTGVPGPVPSDPVPTGGGTPASPLSYDSLLAMVLACQAAIGPAIISLKPHLPSATPAELKRVPRAPATAMTDIAAMARLLRSHPELGPHANAHEMDSAVTLVTDLRQLAATFQGGLDAVNAAARLVLGDGWGQTRDVYALAQRVAPGDTVVAAAIAPMQARMHRGKRVTTATTVADTARNRAAAAQQRATRLHTKAQAAAAAAAHASGGSFPLANPQGPAASADVAPQGPAPGR